MKCKFCDAEMADWGGFCPVCGKSNAEEPEQTPVTEALLEEEELLLQNPETEEPEEEGPSPKLKKMKRNMAMAGCLALLAVLATVLFFGIRSDGDIGKWFDWLKPKENNIYRMESYTAEDKKVVKKGDVVVATMSNGLELTNTQLQFYYWTEVYNFHNENYYYLSYLGFDYTKPLDEQVCYFDSTMTWQQYFLQSALDSWHSNMAFVTMAKENNYQLPEEYQSSLDTMAEDLEATAKKNGYASADAMVQESFGASVTLQDFIEYTKNTYVGYLYFADLYEAVEPTLEELNAYFLANQQKLEGSGIKQDGTYTVDVRHILVHIDTIAEELEKDSESTGKVEGEYPEEYWETCRQAAQEILDKYLAGEMTEEHFGQLANEHSHDKGGQVTDGGIYTGVKQGDMVAEFDSWCFDENRKSGDTGLVKTKFGYHVMYFVGSEEVWVAQTRSAYMSEKSNEIVTEALSRFTVEVTYKKIVLANVEL